MTLNDIFIIFLILASATLSVVVIIFLKRIMGQADEVRKDIHRLVENAIPAMNNLEEFVERANKIVTEVEGYRDEMDNVIKNVRERISTITSNNSFRAVESAAKYLNKNIKALAGGISAFRNAYKRM